MILWVYNSEFDVVREVELVPTRNWGGEGAVGAELGYGALHRLPVGLGEEVEGPGEVVFETREGETSENIPEGTNPSYPQAPAANFLVPANMTGAPPLASQTRASPSPDNRSPSNRRGKPRPAAPAAFDDYFAEGEQKSREQDFAPSRKSPLPPPPRLGVEPPPMGTPAAPEEVEGSPGPTQES